MRWSLILLVIFLGFFQISANAELSCNFKTSCSSGETDVFHISNLSNAHAELPSYNKYEYKLCCGGVKGLSTSCLSDAEVLFRMSNFTNAHVEKSTLSNYPETVCLYSTEGDLKCNYVNSPSLCDVLGSGYKCLATIYNETNAHVSSYCDGEKSYGIKICCEYRDLTPPVTAISPELSSWTNQDVSFTLTCSDKGGYCQTTYFKIINDGDQCGSSGFSAGVSGIVTCSQGSACLKRVCYYSVDDYGNNEPVKTSGIFSIDKRPPVTTDNSDDYWHGNNVKVNLLCQDSESGCKKTYYCVYYEGGTPCDPTTEGNVVDVSCQQSVCRKIVRYYSIDNLGNQESIHNSKTIKIDVSLPACSLLPLAEYTNSAIINISWYASSQGSQIINVSIEKRENGVWENIKTFESLSGSYDFFGQNNRTYYFRCVARSSVGESYSGVFKTTVDTGPPFISVSAPVLTNKTAFDVIWLGGDNETGIINYSVYYKVGPSAYNLWDTFSLSVNSAKFGQDDMPLAPQNNNTYTFKARVMDRAGNPKESAEALTFVDTGKPNCTIENMPAFQPSGTFTVKWYGTDGESGIKEFIVEKRLGTGNWEQFYRGSGTSKSIENAQDGIYRFRCMAIDNAYNSGDYSSEKNTTLDLKPPEVQTDFNESVYVNDNLTIKAVITDAIRISTVALYYNNTIINETDIERNPNNSVWNIKWIIPNLVKTGMNSFTISVKDVNGNSQNITYNFMVKFCEDGQVRPCGVCGSGKSTCKNGNWSECVGEDKDLLKPEVCNGLDDDCNGIIDDVNGENSVSETKCGCFGQGLIALKQETCNGIDDDCDGEIDELGNCCTPGATQKCGNDVGICKNKRKVCGSDQKWGPCEWEGGPNPGGEICDNNLDDDCDGNVDEDCTQCIDKDGDGYGNPASNLCKYSEQDCDDSDSLVNPGIGEVCDGIDNNCNGEVDEGNCEHCNNQVQDEDEEGVDCGGEDCQPCFVWGWLFLTAGGVVILLILAFVWLHFKRQGRELSWDELKKKWSSSE